MRNIIVTGGTRGLGLAIARELCRSGDRVIALARSRGEQLEKLQAECPAGELHWRACDLSKPDCIPGLFKELRSEFGNPYALVNNAGIGTHGLLATMNDARIEELLRINVLAPVLMSKYMVRALMTGGPGRIVNVSSIVSSTGYSGLAAYSASKSALVGFTRSLAREVGSLGITVNAVAPGFVETEMTGMMAEEDLQRIIRRSALRRLAEPADVAHAVVYLLSDAGRNITGTVLTVDAGATA